MTQPIPLSEVPEDLGRNDPCPCGSGRKYKKCCFRHHQAEKEATKQRVAVEDLITEESTPWDVFRLLQQINENNLPALFFDMLHSEGPAQQRYPTVEAYLVAIENRTEDMLARTAFDCGRIRHDIDDAYLLIERGKEDPTTSNIEVEIVHLRRNENMADATVREVEHVGWRVWDFRREEIAKADVGDSELKFDNFGLEWRAA